ncbi:M56 family metallopeptidase [Streptomyces sp. NBC_01387]|uniref:M56 family metallopeptidase n=1 Tax=unclassified Streptomyces TaxID=2593676 RepID=UPI0020244B3E|nr:MULTISPECIES: M56 family metallopeptidase [unclassified Streptomyces]MCX4549663.1 M56 family metallopeptidase [Streptomyces sp. NBC_01500]WSC21192.1 M56 family metallopeptidase [Streptomyces sp. NBC_01766]WSV55128.1 M56 family metallopeptidase [Streptomyces sp. NBC_01014]
MGVFVLLPLVLPLTALPIARLAEQHLHPRSAARLLTLVAVILAACSTLCLGLLMVVGTAQLPGNPLPDGWSDPEVRDAVPCFEVVGKAAIVALALVAAGCTLTLYRHLGFRAGAHRTLALLPTPSEVAVLPDDTPYAYALPGSPGRIVMSTGMASCLTEEERGVLLAHERAHLTGHHHRLLLASRLAGCANPLLRPLREAVAYSTERWADEEAAQVTGDRRMTARAVGRAALVSRRATAPGLAAFAGAGPVPRRVAALLGPPPATSGWPPALTTAGFAALVAAAGTAASTLSALNSAFALFLVLEAATPL